MITPVKFYIVTPALRDEIESVPLKEIKYGSGHAGNGYQRGWIQGLRMARLFDVAHSELSQFPEIDKAIDALGTFLGDDWGLEQVMVNRLDAHTKLDIHRDGISTNYRFHLPVITNGDCLWWDQLHGDSHMGAIGWYGPVPYSGVLHSMNNDGSAPRFHVISDWSAPK